MTAAAEITSHTAEQTEAIGAGIAVLLVAGDIVLLRGDLGAGKTTLVRGAARALGVEGPITSPTFIIANAYMGRIPVAHLDAWRLSDPDDEEIGLALEAIGEDGVAFIEWPDSIAAGLPEPRVSVDIEHGGGDSRLLRMTGRDSGTDRSLGELVDNLRA
ncbi:MAG: tRNA (adenosine(37)-N6)-threonylcarbamoyltransferase complex ATPase subunit type 1 TsaE [Actinomycetota bacterium]|nr:tRNA (adenosine(37)-N6)-threonylcarbamoyltransferase complex ATPase subunit type 1 TsaE [Actinomycetota bacterium]